MGECCAYEECEYNGQPECRLPDGMECPHGVKADKPTNADRIRAMSHDNLLNFFVELVGNMGCSPNGPFPCFKCDEDGYDECRKCWGEYLQQPAEEEDT